ncbi:MAG: group 1 truncated hemoglobin [Candidatus Melainabacteria bacterium]
MAASLYDRLGGYDAIVAVVNAFLSKVTVDEKLRRFWDHRGADGVARETQLLIDFMCHCAGGPLFYTGRDMRTAHAGMRIDGEDWTRLCGYLAATLDGFGVGSAERGDVLGFVESLRGEICEV